MDHAVLETDRHRYVVVSYLAAGGMGAIYRGRRVSTGRGRGGESDDVVLKQLLPEHTDDPKLIEMFLREARLSAGLDHPNIVRTLDLVNAGDDYYIVMEFVHGGDLRSLLRRARRRSARLPLRSALFIVAEVLGALDYAHRKRLADGRPLGLIHRDVTPSNILIGSSGQVKLTDFGIAKAPTQGSVVFKVKGKVGYMAPEQARGEAVDLRVDLFAAGVVLYELLAGERLFVGNVLASPAAIFSQPIRPPSLQRREVDPELDHLVLRALSLDPAGRFASAQEMREAILQAGARAGLVLDAQALAADLRVACGPDSTRWLTLDVTPQPTLDGTNAIPTGSSDGTGVISYENENDDENDDADPYDDESDDEARNRRPILPTKELTSIVAIIDAPPNPEPQPPAPASGASTASIDPEAFDADESAVTTIMPGDARTRSSPITTSPPPGPMASEPSRISRPILLSPDAPSSRQPPEPLGGQSTAPGAPSLSGLERSLGPRPAVKLAFGVLFLVVLAALGVGLGVLLSGGDPLDEAPGEPPFRRTR